MYILLDIFFEIVISFECIKMVKEPSKDSFESTFIFCPNEILFLSKYFKKSDEESLTPTQMPVLCSSKVDNSLFSIF